VAGSVQWQFHIHLRHGLHQRTTINFIEEYSSVVEETTTKTWNMQTTSHLHARSFGRRGLDSP